MPSQGRRLETCRKVVFSIGKFCSGQDAMCVEGRGRTKVVVVGFIYHHVSKAKATCTSDNISGLSAFPVLTQ